MPEFFRGWVEPAFCPDDADREWFRHRSDVQKYQAFSKTVTKGCGKGDAGSCFDGRNNAGKLSCSSTTRGFCFTFEKRIER
jgi:hypothetical protein